MWSSGMDIACKTTLLAGRFLPLGPPQLAASLFFHCLLDPECCCGRARRRPKFARLRGEFLIGRVFGLQHLRRLVSIAIFFGPCNAKWPPREVVRARIPNFHRRYKGAVGLRRDDPALPAMRLETIFLSVRPIVESLDDAKFHHLVLQQPQGPAGASLGQLGAGQGVNAGQSAIEG
jgi:hypothetical protein